MLSPFNSSRFCRELAFAVLVSATWSTASADGRDSSTLEPARSRVHGSDRGVLAQGSGGWGVPTSFGQHHGAPGPTNSKQTVP